MDSTLRVVTTIPMNEIWDDGGAIAARRDRDLWAEDIKSLLRLGPVEFVIAHVGQKLVWKSASECYSFWKDEVLPHCPTDEHAQAPEEFPNCYCYSASQWDCRGREHAVILLEVWS